MSKCTKCGADVEQGMRFCGECGSEIPQVKKCPFCNTQMPFFVKFCGECGYNFTTGEPTNGSLIGEKSVIAGDISINRSTTSNIVNNANNVTTTHNYITQDETLKVVKCCSCEKPIRILEAYSCNECHGYVCNEHYDSTTGMCLTCKTQKKAAAESYYRHELESVLADGIVDFEEFKHLDSLSKELGISAGRAMELQMEMKSSLAAKKAADNVNDSLMHVEQAQCDRARDLLLVDGNADGALKLIAPIYERHPFNEDVLFVYLVAMSMQDSGKTKSIISSLPVDMLHAYLVMFDIELKNGDLALAEKKLSLAESLWQDNVLLKCRHAELMYAIFIQLNDKTYLAEAVNCMTSLGKPKDKLERTWQFYIKNLISKALGDKIPEVTRDYCEKNDLYYALAVGKISAIVDVSSAESFNKTNGKLEEVSDDIKVSASITSSEVKKLMELAKQDDTNAQYNLANCYNNGWGINENKTEAVKWYRKAAEQGNADAQYNLGERYYYGEGVEEDFAEAVKWYRKAAEQGHADAQNNLGECYYRGEGVEEDEAEAVEWYRKAAEQGNADAQWNLGEMYYYGRGVAQDYAEAVKWYRKAAEQGDAVAQFSLGEMYKNGEGVAQDEAEAVKWYRKAAEQGHARAQWALE